MLPENDFEARFFAALAALASLLVHAVGLVLFVSEHKAAPPPPLVVEIMSEPFETRPAPEAAAEEAAAPLEEPPASTDEPHDVESNEGNEGNEGNESNEGNEGDEGEPLSPRDYRERLRQRERAFERDMAIRRERVAALERFLQERQGDEAPAPSPPGSDEAVFMCGPKDAKEPVVITAARSMARYADLTPAGLFPARYLDEVLQVAREGEALGRIEMALPRREVIVQLDEPEGGLFLVGRRDARCLVGFSWSRTVFPLRFRGLPARYIGADEVVRELVMDVVLHVDATFELTVVSGDALPFTRGTLYDREGVARNLEQRATGARMVRDFLGALLGG